MTIVDRSAELDGGQCGMSELFGLPVRKSRPRRADLIGKRLDVRAGSDHFRVSLGGLLLGLFDRDKRHAGVTGYPLKKMLKFASDGILGFSWAPLKLIGRVGYMFSALSFLGIVYAIARKVLYPSQVVSGWTFTTIVILMIGGIQMIMIGVLGSYIGRIYSEVQGRPLYIIESVRGTTKSDKAKR